MMGSDDANHGRVPDFFGGLGTFGDEYPAHKVFLDAYCIDKYEVTVERYEACVRAGVCSPGELECSRQDTEGYRTVVNHYPAHCHDSGMECPRYPVNCKSYEQAETYCRWIGRRLCTEAEWERAAGGPGPVKRKHPWGNAAVDALKANTFMSGPGHLMPVDALPEGVSAEGVYNLAGNVYEWVQDYYSPYDAAEKGPLLNPKGPQRGILRVGRGGCFLTESSYTSTERTTFNPSFDWG